VTDVINYSIRDFEGTKVVELNGSLTVNTIDIFERLINRITEKESVMLNMENVNVVTSAGVSALIEVSQAAKENEKRVILLWAGEGMVSMSETLDVYGLLIYAESLEEGQTKIRYYT